MVEGLLLTRITIKIINFHGIQGPFTGTVIKYYQASQKLCLTLDLSNIFIIKYRINQWYFITA